MADDQDMAEPFRERRAEARLLCADLMEVEWTDADGFLTIACANLEDISPSGACVQVDKPVPGGTVVRLVCDRRRWSATVKYCVYRDTGYFLGLRFQPGERWDDAEFHPKHLLDLRHLAPGTNGDGKT